MNIVSKGCDIICARESKLLITGAFHNYMGYEYTLIRTCTLQTFVDSDAIFLVKFEILPG